MIIESSFQGIGCKGIERDIGDYEKVAFKELAVKLSKEVVQLCPHSISFSLFHGLLRALPSGVPNAKYLAFETPNTKNQPLSGILNLKKFTTQLQYCFIFETVRTLMLKNFGLFN